MLEWKVAETSNIVHRLLYHLSSSISAVTWVENLPSSCAYYAPAP